MNLSVSVFLICAFCLYFVNSVNVKYYKKYVRLFKNVNGEIINESEKKFYNIICNEQFEQYLRTISKYAIPNLRNTNEDGYEDLYMDYHRFKQNTNCYFVKVSIPIKNTTVKQPVIYCPLHPSFIIPMDTNYGLIQNSNFIAVFPKMTTKLMIFKPILKSNRKIELWELFKILEKVGWISNRKFFPQVFEITIPDSYSKTQAMFNLLSNSAEHLSKMSEGETHVLNVGLAPLICKIICRPGKYKEFIYADISATEYEKPEVEEVTLFSEEPGNYVQFSTLVHKCYREIQTTPKTYADDYRITAGPLINSYILLHKTQNVLKVIEFILNLHIDYMNVYDSY